jgi:hypothetical protein
MHPKSKQTKKADIKAIKTILHNSPYQNRHTTANTKTKHKKAHHTK